MKTWLLTARTLLSVIACYGETEVAGLTFAGDVKKATDEVKAHYEGEKKEESFLKRYDAEKKAWVDISASQLAGYANAPTYVISHGLNATYDSKWIDDSAAAIQKSNGDALILSVNWDVYSGAPQDKNFAASTWINAVSTVLAEDLGGLKNIKSFVGHSYGAHLLAETSVKMSKADNLGEKQISFVALDPAEETLTFTGDKNGNSTFMWDKNKRSKDWELPSNIVSEEYKSSGLLGTEERLCDYNYFVAKKGSITPKAIGGDLKTGVKTFIDNHSLAPEWFADYLTKYASVNNRIGAYVDSGNGQLIGGFFNAEVDASRQERTPSNKDIHNEDKGWDGIVNKEKSIEEIAPDKPSKLEYSSGNIVHKSWQSMANAHAQDLLYHDSDGKVKTDKSNWEGTVLNPSKYLLYKIFHGSTKKGAAATDESGNIAIRTDDDMVFYYNANDDKYYSYSLDSGDITEFQNSDDAIIKAIKQQLNTDTSSDVILDSAIVSAIQNEMNNPSTQEDPHTQSPNQTEQPTSPTPEKKENDGDDSQSSTNDNPPPEMNSASEPQPLDGESRFKELLNYCIQIHGLKGTDAHTVLSEILKRKDLTDADRQWLWSSAWKIYKCGDNINNILEYFSILDDSYRAAQIYFIAQYLPFVIGLPLEEIGKAVQDGKFRTSDMDEYCKVWREIGEKIFQKYQDLITGSVGDVIFKFFAPKVLQKIDFYKMINAMMRKAYAQELLERIERRMRNLQKKNVSSRTVKKLKKQRQELLDYINQLGREINDISAKENRGEWWQFVGSFINSVVLRIFGNDEGDDNGGNVDDDDNIEDDDTGEDDWEKIMYEYFPELDPNYPNPNPTVDPTPPQPDSPEQETHQTKVNPLDPTYDPWGDVWDSMPDWLGDVCEKVLTKAEAYLGGQLDKLIAKWPGLQNVLNHIGIDGTGIIRGVVNIIGVLITAPDIATAISQLTSMALNALKQIATRLIQWGVQWLAETLLGNIVPQAVQWIEQQVSNWLIGIATPVIDAGLNTLRNQINKCAQRAGFKIVPSVPTSTTTKFVGDLINNGKQSQQGGSTVFK